MKPNNQLTKNKLTLNKQTVAKLDANQLNAVRAGNANAQALTSLPCIVTLSITISCSKCEEEAN